MQSNPAFFTDPTPRQTEVVGGLTHENIMGSGRWDYVVFDTENSIHLYTQRGGQKWLLLLVDKNGTLVASALAFSSGVLDEIVSAFKTVAGGVA